MGGEEGKGREGKERGRQMKGEKRREGKESERERETDGGREGKGKEGRKERNSYIVPEACYLLLCP